MNRQEYEKLYLENCPSYVASNGVFEYLVKETYPEVVISRVGNSGFAERNEHFINLPGDRDITDKELEKLSESDIELKLEKLNEIYQISQKKFENLLNIYKDFFDNLMWFNGDERELAQEINKSMHCVEFGNSGFAHRREFCVFPNQEIATQTLLAGRALKGYDKRGSRYISEETAERVIKFVSEDIKTHKREWIDATQEVFDTNLIKIAEKESLKNRFKDAQVHFAANEYQLIDVLDKIKGIELRHIGRSGFASRNSKAINALPEIDIDKDMISFETIKEQIILSDAVYQWANIQLQKQKEIDFITAYNANKDGICSIVSEGGHNKDYIVPDNYKCLLSIKTANTQDYRQGLSHTYNNIYIDMSQLSKIRGNLHINLPKDYMGLFIGKGGVNINRILSELKQINPAITGIKLNKKELDMKTPDFVNNLKKTDSISLKDVVKEYFDKYATKDEVEFYNSFYAPEKKDPEKELYVVPQNDAEAVAIINMLKEAGRDVLITSQPWGASWENLEDEIKEKLKTADSDTKIIGIELQGNNPYGAINIDHHSYANDDRSNPRSSIEQVAKRINTHLSLEQWFIAANDKGFIPAMEQLSKRVFFPFSNKTKTFIRHTRRLDREAQGITPEQELSAEKAIKESLIKKGDLTVVELPHNKCATVTDRLYGQYKDLLIICGDGMVNFYGDSQKIAELNEKFPGGWMGGQLDEGSGFWGGYPSQDDVKHFFEIEEPSLYKDGTPNTIDNLINQAKDKIENNSKNNKGISIEGKEL